MQPKKVSAWHDRKILAAALACASRQAAFELGYERVPPLSAAAEDHRLNRRMTTVLTRWRIPCPSKEAFLQMVMEEEAAQKAEEIPVDRETPEE